MTTIGDKPSSITNNQVNSARLLVVDDEPDIADSLRDYLHHKTGSRVEIANSGEEAISAMEAALNSPAGAFDLVVLDMRMPPGMNGRAVLDWIRQHPKLLYTRVIILTATAVAEERVAALSAGADDYITKPYQPPELLARVRTILRSHKLEKQLQQQSQQLSTLNQVGLLMTTKRNTKAVIETAVNGARDILQTNLAAVFMLQKETGQLQCRHLSSQQATPPSYPLIHPSHGIIGHAFTQKETFCLNYPKSDPIYKPEIDAPPHTQLHNLIVAPFMVRGHGVGVLLAANKANGDFTNLERGLFNTLTNSVSRAIENAMLFQNVRQRQEELLESRNRLQGIIDGIPHDIYTVNDQYDLVAVNQNKANTVQISSVDLVGKKCYEAFFNRSKPCERCMVAKTVQYSNEFRWSVRELSEDNLPREWDVNAYPIPTGKDGNNQIVVVWEDITEERRLEYSLQQAAKLAAIGQLAAGVAHEINNPMAVINASAAMLKLGLKEDKDQYELADMIEQAGERAAKVVRNLMDFARQEEYEFDSLDINESIRAALALVTYQLTSAHVEIVTDFGQDLPFVYASGEHLKIVWINLIINARDALRFQDENKKIEFITRLEPEKGNVRIMVRDNGQGISQSLQVRIFEPFFTTKDPGEGTGLGLSTGHRIIEQHAGMIEVFSEEGVGTTFIVRLPVNLD